MQLFGRGRVSKTASGGAPSVEVLPISNVKQAVCGTPPGWVHSQPSSFKIINLIIFTTLAILIPNPLENSFRTVLKIENKINFDRLLLNQFLERIISMPESRLSSSKLPCNKYQEKKNTKTQCRGTDGTWFAMARRVRFPTLCSGVQELGEDRSSNFDTVLAESRGSIYVQSREQPTLELRIYIQRDLYVSVIWKFLGIDILTIVKNQPVEELQGGRSEMFKDSQKLTKQRKKMYKLVAMLLTQDRNDRKQFNLSNDETNVGMFGGQQKGYDLITKVVSEKNVYHSSLENTPKFSYFALCSNIASLKGHNPDCGTNILTTWTQMTVSAGPRGNRQKAFMSLTISTVYEATSLGIGSRNDSVLNLQIHQCERTRKKRRAKGGHTRDTRNVRMKKLTLRKERVRLGKRAALKLGFTNEKRQSFDSKVPKLQRSCKQIEAKGNDKRSPNRQSSSPYLCNFTKTKELEPNLTSTAYKITCEKYPPHFGECDILPYTLQERTLSVLVALRKVKSYRVLTVESHLASSSGGGTVTAKIQNWSYLGNFYYKSRNGKPVKRRSVEASSRAPTCSNQSDDKRPPTRKTAKYPHTSPSRMLQHLPDEREPWFPLIDATRSLLFKDQGHIFRSNNTRTWHMQGKKEKKRRKNSQKIDRSDRLSRAAINSLNDKIIQIDSRERESVSLAETQSSKKMKHLQYHDNKKRDKIDKNQLEIEKTELNCKLLKIVGSTICKKNIPQVNYKTAIKNFTFITMWKAQRISDFSLKTSCIMRISLNVKTINRLNSLWPYNNE
ncbi:hypothetical protein WN51_05496 [Melipona quadrifasciata]|uniref:Uncharacterized protein n=1 Tax=Melipona quadrifasciata TaxID=166423 RepID=A0A0N0BKM5_9HYME|nr:hypothetical protein WN51_05496 [Melipona quadrifasciata]